MQRRAVANRTRLAGIASSAAVAMFATAGPAVAQSIPGLSEGQTMLLIACGMLAIFAGIGGYMIYSGITNRGLAKAAELWPTAGGRVLTSEVGKRTSYNRKSRTTTTVYAPHISYAYAVAGNDYQSSVVRFGDLERNGSQLAQDLVAKYPSGSTIVVRYDPKDPNRATLETASAGGRQIATGAFFIAVPLFIAAVGALIFGFGSDGPSLPPEVLEQLNQPK